MNLDRELLFRFFNKETTLEEEKKIRLWIDECDEHRCEFFRERQLFDAILLHGDPSYEKSRDRKSTRLNSSHIEESRMPSSA